MIEDVDTRSVCQGMQFRYNPAIWRKARNFAVFRLALRLPLGRRRWAVIDDVDARHVCQGTRLGQDPTIWRKAWNWAAFRLPLCLALRRQRCQ